jgi:hypothetical protein
MDGCTNITSTITIEGQSVNQMNFSNMTNLRKLYIQNCTGITSDIDLTGCTEIREVDASGTTINIAVPTGAKLTKYELGTPTAVNLTNPTVLTPAQVVVDHSANITSLDLINIPNNKSFTMFDKITTTV